MDSHNPLSLKDLAYIVGTLDGRVKGLECDIKEIKLQLNDINKKLNILTSDLTRIKTISRFWGAVAGFVASIASVIISGLAMKYIF